MHLVDATLFYSPTSGGVKRYLSAKHAWLGVHTSWEHTIVVPGRETHTERGGVCTLSGYPVPGTFNYRLPLNPRRWTRLLEELEPTLIEAGDVFHPAWAGWLVAQRRGIPLIGFYHSNLPQLAGRRSCGWFTEPVLRRYVRLLYERCDLVFAPSRLMCEYLRSLGLTQVAHQPLGVDAEVFNPARRTEGLRAWLGLPAHTRVLVYAGRFAEEKNLPVLLQAFARLGARYHLLLIGGARRARPAPNVTMVPYRRDSHELARWIASADALVHAGTKETFGLVILEAMACGRPVVAARAGAFPEFVDDTVGMLAEPHSAAGMAEAIAALYERDVAAVGAAGRERVLRHFTWGRAFHNQLATYASLLGTQRVPLDTPILDARPGSS
ncbi:MAG: glycosyltransferase [Gammaproteobacteria bacterium]|nr:glycosyltransferase [Gammaproteobacteria bacterium]MBV9725635.1 glycosyltransferase [Gammaproteobacteria bacterium]